MASIEIKWLQEFIDKIDNKKEVTTALNQWIKKVVFFLEWEAKVFTPVDNWFLVNWYKEKYWNLTWKLFNTLSYAAAVHEWHAQEVWRYVPVLKARLVQPFVKWNPFLTKTVAKSAREVNLIFNEELTKDLTILQ